MTPFETEALKMFDEHGKKCKNPQCFVKISPNEAPDYCPVHNEENTVNTPYVLPMGISQWKEYGKKYGYWDYYVEEVIKSL